MTRLQALWKCGWSESTNCNSGANPIGNIATLLLISSSIWGFAADLASAILGMVGTWLMARRYAPHFLRAILWALLAVFMYRKAREFFVTSAAINKNVPDSAADMVLGINLLFWAFFLQLVAKLLA